MDAGDAGSVAPGALLWAGEGRCGQSPHSMTAQGPPSPELAPLGERDKKQVAELLIGPGHFRAQGSEDRHGHSETEEGMGVGVVDSGGGGNRLQVAALIPGKG